MRASQKGVIILLLCLIISIMLYLWAIAPRIFHRPDMEPFSGWLYAHRGLYDNQGAAPENSQKAFGAAVEAGYGIELDIQLTKDKIPVVFHDDTLKRVCGAEGRVRDYTFWELRQLGLCSTKERIPELEEVLERIDGQVPLIIELKVPGTDLSLCPITDKVLAEYKGLYCVESFNPLAVGWYRKNRPGIVRGQLSAAFLKERKYKGVFYFFLQNLLLNFISRPDFVAYNHEQEHNVSRRVCRKLFHSTAAAWTIRNEQELERAKLAFDLFIFEGFRPKTVR